MQDIHCLCHALIYSKASHQCSGLFFQMPMPLNLLQLFSLALIEAQYLESAGRNMTNK